MKTLDRRELMGMAGLAGMAMTAGPVTAGSLEPPPGPVMSTMKPLDQIEPRTPTETLPGNASAQYVISVPGAYYLTAPIIGEPGKHGILITAANVSIDLAGFPMQGDAATKAAIKAQPGGNVIIRNGSVRGWGEHGVDLAANFDSIVLEMISTNNAGAGFALGDACLIRDCVARDNGGDNIVAGFNTNVLHCSAIGSATGNGIKVGPKSRIRDCVANFNKVNGVLASSACMVTGTLASQNLLGSGIIVDASGTIDECKATDNAVSGITVGTASTLRACTAAQNAGAGVDPQLMGAGISTAGACVIDHCVAYDNTGNGIATGFGSAVFACSSTYNDRAGIVLGPESEVKDCTISSNGGDGIRVRYGSRVYGNCVDANGNAINGSAGIRSQNGPNRIEQNFCSGNVGTGILSESPSGNDVIVCNSSINNLVNYSPSSGPNFGPLSSPGLASASPWSNF